MATIAEMFVDIGADTSEFEKETKKMQKGMKGMDKELKTLAQDMGTNANQMGDDWQNMSKELQQAFKGAKDNMKSFDVDIGADTTEFEAATQTMRNDMKTMRSETRSMAQDMGVNATQMGRDWKYMSTEMKDAFKASKDSMLPFKQAQQEVQYEFFKMSKGMKDYGGSTKDFMGDLEAMGKRQKKVTDDMMKNNEMLKMGFITGIATMMARSGQSEKIAANFERMNNPLYTVNNGLLKITGGLEKMAKAGMPATMALSLLGPTANMKELHDMTMLITTGMMRFTMVALAAAVASALVYSSLFKAAKGPDPSTVFAQQEAALTHYRDTVKARAQEINDAFGLFENIEIKKIDGKALIANLDEQVGAIKTWRSNLALIGKLAGEEFANSLAEMGPSAAGEIQAIANMSKPELDKYVGLWREKMGQAGAQASSEMTKLRDETVTKVKELQDTLTPLGTALEPMKAAWESAFQPMVDAFTLVSVPVAIISPPSFVLKC